MGMATYTRCKRLVYYIANLTTTVDLGKFNFNDVVFAFQKFVSRHILRPTQNTQQNKQTKKFYKQRKILFFSHCLEPKVPISLK